ncbi:hypothetical protein B0H15DRAFT_807814, partial [Mycena belliarum]
VLIDGMGAAARAAGARVDERGDVRGFVRSAGGRRGVYASGSGGVASLNRNTTLREEGSAGPSRKIMIGARREWRALHSPESARGGPGERKGTHCGGLSNEAGMAATHCACERQLDVRGAMIVVCGYGVWVDGEGITGGRTGTVRKRALGVYQSGKTQKAHEAPGGGSRSGSVGRTSKTRGGESDEARARGRAEAPGATAECGGGSVGVRRRRDDSRAMVGKGQDALTAGVTA